MEDKLSFEELSIKYKELLESSEFYREQLEEEIENQNKRILTLENDNFKIRSEIKILRRNFKK